MWIKRVSFNWLIKQNKVFSMHPINYTKLIWSKMFSIWYITIHLHDWKLAPRKRHDFLTHLVLPVLYISPIQKTASTRQDIETNVRVVRVVTKTTVSPISSFVTSRGFTLECSASRGKGHIVGLTKTPSWPRVTLTSSFLSEVISSVDVLHKHKTNIREAASVCVSVCVSGGFRGTCLKEKGLTALNLILPFRRQA